MKSTRSKSWWRRRPHERHTAATDSVLYSKSAPFSVEQRTWLNGLFAGLFGLEEGVTPLSSAEVAKLLPGFIDAGAAPATEIDDGAPWHDPAMILPDRMKLAEGKPLRRRMMVAMAKQDCGQCGYNCHDYSEALFSRKEERLNLCVPGGKDTARMLKQLYEEIVRAPAVAKAGDAPVAEKQEVPLGAWPLPETIRPARRSCRAGS